MKTVRTIRNSVAMWRCGSNCRARQVNKTWHYFCKSAFTVADLHNIRSRFGSWNASLTRAPTLACFCLPDRNPWLILKYSSYSARSLHQPRINYPDHFAPLNTHQRPLLLLSRIALFSDLPLVSLAFDIKTCAIAYKSHVQTQMPLFHRRSFCKESNI